jgi:Ca2+-binding RTX toxin-like protein
MAHWELALRTHFKLDQVWGAETAGEAAGADSSTLYTLDNASWNGALSQGQTTTFGFVARTDIAGTLDVTQILAAVSLATDGVPAELPPLPASGSVDTGIEIVGTWWGGFQGQITITADENVTHWEMLLKSQFKIDSIWGAEKAAEVSSPDGGTLYSLDNAKWNGSLAKGQTATIGFTAQTGINGVMAAEEIKKFITLAEDQGSVTRALNATSGARQVVGGTGSDTLFGSASKDVLTGLSGQDAFVFNTKLNRKTNVDKLTDFSVRDDTIELENAIFKKVGAKTGTLKKDFFRVGDKAKDGNDYVIYDKKKGVLYYDADGSGHGAAVQYATIQKNLKMTYKDLFVI